MQGVEISHLNAAIHAILKAFYDICNASIQEALRPIHAYGKSDTLGMDAMPEITIVEQLGAYDKNAIVITEEVGAKRTIDGVPSSHPRTLPTIFLSDPTDRSSQMKKFLNMFPDKTQLVGDVLKNPDSIKLWEENFSSPVSITGASSAISCVRHGVPIFAVIVNYITKELFVACGAGNFMITLPAEPVSLNLDFIRKKGKPITFPGIDGDRHAEKNFVTFVGKDGYLDNLISSRLIEEGELKDALHYELPGGPSRILYLSAIQNRHKPQKKIGFVLANGEKIGEWIHWLPFVRFARSYHDQSLPALRLYEIYQDRPWTKEGILMSTPPIYSVFKPISAYDSKMIIDVNALGRYPNPSKVRATLVVAPFDNGWATRSVNQYGYRPIEFFSGE
jgi:hypothetical protein